MKTLFKQMYDGIVLNLLTDNLKPSKYFVTSNEHTELAENCYKKNSYDVQMLKLLLKPK